MDSGCAVAAFDTSVSASLINSGVAKFDHQGPLQLASAKVLMGAPSRCWRATRAFEGGLDITKFAVAVVLFVGQTACRNCRRHARALLSCSRFVDMPRRTSVFTNFAGVTRTHSGTSTPTRPAILTYTTC